MKERMYVQIGNNENEIGFLKTEAKNQWKSAGNLVKDISSLDFYIKPQENKCYYVINEDFSGSVDLV